MHAVALDDSMVRVYWFPLKDTQGENIALYQISYQEIPEPEVIDKIGDKVDLKETTVETVRIDGEVLTTDLMGLEEGAMYQITARAQTEEGLKPEAKIYIQLLKDAVSSLILGKEKHNYFLFKRILFFRLRCINKIK